MRADGRKRFKLVARRANEYRRLAAEAEDLAAVHLHVGGLDRQRHGLRRRLLDLRGNQIPAERIQDRDGERAGARRQKPVQKISPIHCRRHRFFGHAASPAVLEPYFGFSMSLILSTSPTISAPIMSTDTPRPLRLNWSSSSALTPF